MPQFELDEVGSERAGGLHRGRSAEDAVRRATSTPHDVAVSVGEEDVQGWRAIEIDGRPAGRVRLHQRMRFRRD